MSDARCASLPPYNQLRLIHAVADAGSEGTDLLVDANDATVSTT